MSTSAESGLSHLKNHKTKQQQRKTTIPISKPLKVLLPQAFKVINTEENKYNS